MTKRWSSTASLDGQTKRQASKAMRRDGKRMWCQSCGTITYDNECDCTMYGNPESQKLHLDT